MTETPTTEVATVEPQAIEHRGHLSEQMRYAQALAAAGLLPPAYRKQPANVLLAMEYAKALDIPNMTVIQGVHIVDGKPTASSALVGALVRKAGHRLRIVGDDTRAVCEIVRHDDPSFTFRSEWTIDRARAAGLTGKGTWKQYPASMLKARAITECARDACPEALSGVQYTPEELGDDDPFSNGLDVTQTGSGANGAQGDPATASASAHETAAPEPDIEDAVLVPIDEESHRPPAATATREGMGLPVSHGVKPATQKQIGLVAARARHALKTAGVICDEDHRTDLILVSEALQRPYLASLKDMTPIEASRFLDLTKDDDLTGLVTTLCAQGILTAEVPS